MSSSNDELLPKVVTWELSIKKEVEEQAVNEETVSTLAASLSSVQLTSSPLSSITVDITSTSPITSIDVSSDYKLQFCSSNSSLNTSFYEMNQVIDLTKNEYFTKTSLNSPNKLTQAELFIDADINDQQLSGRSQESTILFESSSDAIDTTIELDSNNNIFIGYHHQLESEIALKCDANNDILLSNALSIDISESFLKTMESVANTTSTTDHVELMNLDMLSQKGFYSNECYGRPVGDMSDTMDKNFVCFENEVMHTNDLLQHNSRLNHHHHQFSMLSVPSNDDQFSLLRVSDREYLNANNKHDVSIGTDLSISRDIRFKKDFSAIEHLKMKRPSEKESFKLIEKVQPKKSRTKYSKDQIEVLENAYIRNPYPDVITVEQLCKTLEISREKVNIWFQNRRARTKRTNRIMQDGGSTPVTTYQSSNARSQNGYTKLYQATQITYSSRSNSQEYYTAATPYENTWYQVLI